MGELLEAVMTTLHGVIRQAHHEISDPGLKMLDFLSSYPAQVGLLGLQMIWTHDAQEALELTRSDKKVCGST